MKIFGLSITRAKALAGASPVGMRSGGWLPIIHEPFTGAWQRNVEVNPNQVLNYSTVFRCIGLISSDIAKLRIRLVEQDSNGIWNEVEANSPFWPVLRKPNRYQNRLQFFVSWMESKLINGNTYVLKERDQRGIVTNLYVLDPNLVTVLVADDGSVYYELRTDNLSGLRSPNVTVPSSEIIHDRWNTLRHPLVGSSPITAAGLAALQGIRIQENSATFFASGANPGGVLSAPGFINEETALRIKEYWDSEYSAGGASVGRVAVLGDGLEYKPMMMSATDSQLLEQLKWTAETVASVFGVPAHMIGIGEPPTYNNIEALNTQYYAQCLQYHIESIELALDEGLALPKPLGTEFDRDDLLLMDSTTRMKVAADGVMRGIFAPDEARFRFNLPPVTGGANPYLQQQNFSLEALHKRDQEDPFSKPAPAPASPPAAQASTEETTNDGDNAGVADGDGDDERASEYVEYPIGSGQWVNKDSIPYLIEWLGPPPAISHADS